MKLLSKILVVILMLNSVFITNYFKADDKTDNYVELDLKTIENTEAVEIIKKDKSDNLNLKNKEIERATKLNKNLGKVLNNLEELNSIIQYIAQAINKGAIKVSDKKDVLKWIHKNQDIIKFLEKNYTFPLTEPQLFKLIFSTQKLIINIYKNLKSNLEEIEDFNLPIFRKYRAVNLEKIENMSSKTQNLITLLKKEASEAGLTKINKVARKLDLLNDKYKITRNLKYIPLGIAAGLTAVYITPQRYFDSLNNNFINHFFPPLSKLLKLKNYLGKCESTEPNESESNAVENIGAFNKFLNLINNKKIRNFTTVSLTALPYLTSEEIIPGTLPLHNYVRKYWTRLKGYEYESNSKYQIIDNITLDDKRLIGLDSQIEELKKIATYVANPDAHDRVNSSPEKGILLTGPSRCGKTFAARAVCGTLNKRLKEQGYNSRFGFRELKWGEVKWSSEGIKTLIEEAKRNAPCIIFIDELHNLPLQTKEGGETLTEFLTGMSGINSENDARHQVIILAATNKPEMLDSALLQPGRFGTIIRFEKPNYKNRKKYFKTMFKHNAINTDNIDIESLARQTEKCSYGDLETIIKGARFTACTLAKNVTQENLQEKINKHIHRLRGELPLTKEEKAHLAAYQAGQALMYLLLDPQEKLEFITLKGRWKKIQEIRFWEKEDSKNAIKNLKSIKYGNIFTYNPSESIKIQDSNEKIKQCKIKLSGALAEKLLLGSYGYGSQNNNYSKDKKQALEYIKSINLDGLEVTDLPKSIKEKLDTDSYNMLKKLETETVELLTKHRTILEKVAYELETKETLSATDIKLFLSN